MPNPYYNPSGTPGESAEGSSAAIRAEFARVQQGFAKLPQTLTPGGIVTVNLAGTAMGVSTPGEGSGLNADLLDGKHAADFEEAGAVEALSEALSGVDGAAAIGTAGGTLAAVLGTLPFSRTGTVIQSMNLGALPTQMSDGFYQLAHTPATPVVGLPPSFFNYPLVLGLFLRVRPAGGEFQAFFPIVGQTSHPPVYRFRPAGFSETDAAAVFRTWLRFDGSLFETIA